MQNVYEYFVQFRSAAKRAKWPKQRIDAVLTEARSGNYENALSVLLAAMDQIEGIWSEQAEAELD